jgi:hypothetical protein
MDRAMSRELELRKLLREIDRLEGQAQQLETQMRQLQLNEIAKLDARDSIVPATEARISADRLKQATDALERRAKDASRGSYNGSTTIPGLVGALKDRSSRLVKSIRKLEKEIERLRGAAHAKLMNPIRHSGGASIAFPTGSIGLILGQFFGAIHNLIDILSTL